MRKLVAKKLRASQHSRSAHRRCKFPCCSPSLKPAHPNSAAAPPSALRARLRDGGAAESYFGLWRDHEPHGHGMFRWFDGDMYFGEWSGGLFEGYGVYQYGPLGAYAYDRSA